MKARDKKKKETADAVQQMRERLRSMGLLKEVNKLIRLL